MENEVKGNARARLGVWLVFGGVVAVGMCVGGYVWLERWWAQAWGQETRDVGKYAAVLKDWGPGMVGHFPSSVPGNAEEVHFAAAPKVLQGCGYVQLRVKLPAVEVARIEAQLKKDAMVAQFTDTTMTTYVSPPTFWTADAPKARGDFPAQYMLYVLYAKDLADKWDHGETRGVAISASTREIVYWAEYW